MAHPWRMNQLAIALLVTLGGVLIGAAGATNDAPAVASLGWLLAVVGGAAAIGYAIRLRRPSGRA